ncbi:MAG: tetratricopeptide repeat protein [Pseudomonadota bacterium]
MRLIGFLSILLLGASLAACGERETSFEELLATAEAGDANAQYAVGIIYQEGRGVEKDLGKTIAWYEKAAAKGEVNALYTLGYMSHHGIGMAQNFDKAAQWYRAAGDKGHPKAMFELARLYMRGLGVERSFAEAVRWIEKAANQDMFEAQWRMGEIYTSGGVGIESDIEKAKMWYDRAEKGGDLTSDYNPDYRYPPD